MFLPRIIPVLLLKGKGLVKTINFNRSTYIGDPINAVKIFNDLKADELIFLDIEASQKRQVISSELVKNIGDEAFMPFAVGGGICEAEQAVELINSGAEKVVFNTTFITNPLVITKTARLIGNQGVIVSIDVKQNFLGRYNVYIVDGKKKVSMNVVDAAKRAFELGAGEIMITSIDQDGRMNGYDLNLIRIVANSVSIPVIACGGAGNLTDFREAYKFGAHAMAAGSLFVYHGDRKGVLINYPEKQEIQNLFK